MLLSTLPGIIFCGAQNTPHTHAQQHSRREREREVVITGGGPQPPIKHLAIAVHHRPATRAWCGPLLLVLLGGFVTLFVLYAYCLMSKILGCAWAKKHKTSEV